MATNGNRNDITSNGINRPIDNGLSSWQQNRSVQNQFRYDTYKDSGYLSESIKELEEMDKLYVKLQNHSKEMTKAERVRFNTLEQSNKDTLNYLNKIRKDQGASDKEIMAAIKRANEERLKGLEAYRKELLILQEADKKHADNYKKELRDVSAVYDEVSERINDINGKLDETGEILKNSSKTFSKAMSESLGKASKTLGELSNMFNLQKIANNSMEQDARSKLALRGSVSRQFGFTNNSQFESFKNSLNDTLKNMNSSMGYLFNSEDMRNYMANFSKYGITSTDVAQQQMKSSIIAEKYLGVSAETQTQIFKYMKRTNDYEMLDKHNRVITSLLKSQLGVSKEQLDALSTIAYTSVEDLAAIGMSEAAQKAYSETSIASGAVLSSMIGDNSASAINQLWASFLKTSKSQLGNWAPILGNTNMVNLQDKGRYGESKEAQLAAYMEFINTIKGSTALTSRNMDIQQVLQEAVPEFNSAAVNGIRSLNSGDFYNQVLEELQSINNLTDKEVEEFVEQSEEATWLEKIYNYFDTLFNGVDWRITVGLANAAFTAYLASKAFEVFGNIKQAGGIKNFFTSFFGKGSTLGGGAEQMSLFASGGGKAGSALGALGTGAAVVGLTAATIAAFSGIAAKKWEEGENRAVKDTKKEIANSSDPNVSKWKNNNAMVNALAQSEQAAKSSWWDDTWNNVGSGFDTWYQNWFSGDYIKKNQSFWNWMNRSGVFSKDAAAGTRQRLAAYFLFDRAGSLESITPKVTRSDLVQIANEYGEAVLQPDVTKIVKAGWAPSDRNGHKVDDKIDWASYLGNRKGQGGPANGFISLHNGRGGQSDSLKSMIHSPWYKITSMYGSRPNPFGGNGTENHGGMDIAAPRGTPIGSAVNGVVDYVFGGATGDNDGSGGGFGNHVVIRGDNGIYYVYGHMNTTPYVKSGQRVQAGQAIGVVGSTGRSTGPHLHFQTGYSRYGSKFDPSNYLTTGVLYPGGAVIGVSDYNSSRDSSSGTPKVQSGRFVPKSFGNATDSTGGPADGATRIVGSVDGGFRNLINYLDSIREEQSTQRAMLEAFSKSRMSESNF